MFLKDKSGSVAVPFALVGALVVSVTMGVVGYSVLHGDKSTLQHIADSAALAGARELYLASQTPQATRNVASAFAHTALDAKNFVDGLVNVDIGDSAPAARSNAESGGREVLSQVKVSIDAPPRLKLGESAFNIEKITVSATAQVVSGGRLCLLALDEGSEGALRLFGTASVDAKKCIIHSNSESTGSIHLDGRSKLYGELICAVGGVVGPNQNYQPSAVTDCPAFDDPLSQRDMPRNAPCDKNDLVIEGGRTTLHPGTYCGGVTIVGNAAVTLRPGLFIIRGGPLHISDSSDLTALGVSFLFTDGARLELKNNSVVEMTASTDGPLAGILIAADKSADDRASFEIQSVNARKFTGLVYLPHHTLRIGDDTNGDGQCDTRPVSDISRADKEDDEDRSRRRRRFPQNVHIRFHYQDGFRRQIGNHRSSSNSSKKKRAARQPARTLGTRGCRADIGVSSDWTAIVAARVEVTYGVNLVLNANYGGSRIPVPQGVGPVGGNIYLTE